MSATDNNSIPNLANRWTTKVSFYLLCSSRWILLCSRLILTILEDKSTRIFRANNRLLLHRLQWLKCGSVREAVKVYHEVRRGLIRSHWLTDRIHTGTKQTTTTSSRLARAKPLAKSSKYHITWWMELKHQVSETPLTIQAKLIILCLM